MLRTTALSLLPLLAIACGNPDADKNTDPIDDNDPMDMDDPKDMDDPEDPEPVQFKVTIENVAMPHDLFGSGHFDTPVGASSPAPIHAGESYAFSFGAAPGDKLSFATMFVHSNDLFYAPDGMGIDLFDNSDMPITGDVTSQVMLWDAGTEMNQEPGEGADQAPRQSGPDTGAADSNTQVRLVSDGFTYPAVTDVLEATLSHDGHHVFTLTLKNVSTSSTLMTSQSNNLDVPLAPGVFAVHTGNDPLFTAGMMAPMGLEALAEDGNPAGQAAELAMDTGLTSPFAPGVFAVHSMGTPLFTEGMADDGMGLESLAEDGEPSALAKSVAEDKRVDDNGVFNTPDGANAPGPALPGDTYSFTFEAIEGDRLSFATMLVFSNDLFVAPMDDGLKLFDSKGKPMTGDITDALMLWDAGTEMNQWPGAGPDQPALGGAMTGMLDSNTLVREVDDGFVYPSVDELVKVTLETLE